MSAPEMFREGSAIRHGVNGQYAAVELIRYAYEARVAALEERYFEVLEFSAPPAGRPKAVYHLHSTLTGHTLFNFDTVKEALAFQFTSEVKYAIDNKQPLPDHLKRKMECLGTNLPWFFCPFIRVIGVPGGEGTEMMRRELFGLILPTRGRFNEKFPKELAMNWVPNAYRVPGNQLVKRLRDNGKEFAAHMWEVFYPGIRKVDIGITPDVCRLV